MNRSAREYTYRVYWSAEDACFVATVAEFPSLSCVDDSQEAALRDMVDLVDDTLRDMRERGETPPIPLG